MMHTILILLFSFLSTTVLDAQGIFMTRSGKITFFSSAPVEDIEAHHNSVTVILKTGTGELAFKLFMKSFEFERAAMQDHFNRDFVHSDTYPEATFEGVIENPDAVDFSEPGTYEAEVRGDLTIHGITRPVREAGTIEVSADGIILDAQFMIHLPDYEVKIPSNFVTRISEDIEITVHAELEPYAR